MINWFAEWRVLATAVMFLTRIPIGNAASGDTRDLSRSTQYFPAVGLLVGGIVAIVYLLTDYLWANEIAVGMTMLAAVAVTGGFHEDGLADWADSTGAWNKEHKLEIMRDSRIGTYGALALILVLLLTFLSLSSLAESGAAPNSVDHLNGSVIVNTLILAHVLGRWTALPMIITTPYARDESSNKVFADGVTVKRLFVGSMIAATVAICCSVSLGIGVVYAIIVSFVVLSLLRLWFLRSIDGITGDCLGAANKLVELAVYLTIAAMYN